MRGKTSFFFIGRTISKCFMGFDVIVNDFSKLYFPTLKYWKNGAIRKSSKDANVSGFSWWRIGYFIISKYLPTNNFLITKEQQWIYSGQIW